LAEIVKDLGGISASVGIIFGQFGVLMIISFYFSIAYLIKDYNGFDYHMYLITSTKQMLKNALKHIEKQQVLNKDIETLGKNIEDLFKID